MFPQNEKSKTEEVNGKKRIREFYAMPPEDAYSILEAIAEINGFKNRLKKWKATEEEQKAEILAQEISDVHREKAKAFTFSSIGIENGEKVEFVCNGNVNDGTIVTVVDDKHVKYEGVVMSLTALAKQLTGSTSALPGPDYFKYNNKWLNEIRREKGLINF